MRIPCLARKYWSGKQTQSWPDASCYGANNGYHGNSDNDLVAWLVNILEILGNECGVVLCHDTQQRAQLQPPVVQRYTVSAPETLNVTSKTWSLSLLLSLHTWCAWFGVGKGIRPVKTNRSKWVATLIRVKALNWGNSPTRTEHGQQRTLNVDDDDEN